MVSVGKNIVTPALGVTKRKKGRHTGAGRYPLPRRDKRMGMTLLRQGYVVQAKQTKNKGEYMQKVLIVGLMFLMPCVGDALTMCVRDDSLVISLDKIFLGTGSGYNASEMLWWTDFSYGRIYGEATCLSEAEGGKPSGGMGVITNSNGKMLSQDIPAGLKNTDADANERVYCWCRMTHPASSRWVYNNTSSALLCASNCARYCAGFTNDVHDLRGGLFGSVGK